MVREDVRVVEGPLPDAALVVDELPGGARVVRAEEAPVVVLEEGVDPVGVGVDTARPILPTTPSAGMPGFRVISVQVSPPSTDLNMPLPGPPDDIVYSLRKASQSAA